MEELKQEQEMREKRNQERGKWRDGRNEEQSNVSGPQNSLITIWFEHKK